MSLGKNKYLILEKIINQENTSFEKIDLDSDWELELAS